MFNVSDRFVGYSKAIIFFVFAMGVSNITLAEGVMKLVSFDSSGGEIVRAPALLTPANFSFPGSVNAPSPLALRLEGPLTVNAGDRWETVFARLQLEAVWLDSFVGFKSRLWPTHPQEGARIWTQWTRGGTLSALYYCASTRQMVRVSMLGRTISIQIGQRQKVDGMSVSEGLVPNFYRVTDDLHLPELLVNKFIAIFEGATDFHNDLANGYSATVLYEMVYSPEKPAQLGRILAARLTTAQQTQSAYLIAGGNEIAPSYYGDDGKPLRQTFLKSPLVFSRVTSGYAIKRFHPILRRWRAHSGIDYAAPLGSPVRATADGVVEDIGLRGEYGNRIILRHRSDMTTYYAHLSDVKADLRKGMAIVQGEVIGQVGMTGLATNPHLHYELRENEKPIDPVSFIEPTVTVPDGQKARIAHLVTWYKEKLKSPRPQ